ncbi:MAG: long-chain-fatty-acid--CoA ligase [Alphaproteobacteria bacterium]|nr:MAG: long-chain-fatty-acid--CoA ligase [Alphaproteobacteria bacterium]
MLGQMQDRPLLVSSLVEQAEKFHAEQEIITRTVEGPIHRYTYRDMGLRSRKLAQALQALGVKLGDRIGTLGWNTYRHLEVWYGVTGIGAITHTVNPRLYEDQISYIINHAENKFIFTDTSFIKILERLEPQLQTVEAFIIMTDKANMPDTSLKNVMCYEDLIDAQDGDLVWSTFEENTAAAMCYTSGTTGNPKGVLYSNRSCVLHAMASAAPDVLNIGSETVVMAVVPMFHANGWGIPYVAPMHGAKLVLPGPHMDGASIYELLNQEKVTFTAAVPTVWLMLLAHIEENNLELPFLDRVVIGGSAAPRTMIETFEKKYGVIVGHAWGMTEMNPLGSLGTMKASMQDLPYETLLDYKCKQGRGVYGVEFKITDDDANRLPWDGESSGHLMVRGPWVVQSYFRGEGGKILDDEGFFDTGDIAHIDQEGFVQLTDRAKDVIKTGGEWISSIDLENAAVGHPDLAECAVIGVYHPKWDERPLLLAIAAKGKSPTKDDVLAYLSDRVVKWWVPDDVIFVDELPHTATGKLLKMKIREEYKDYKLPTY